MIPFSLRFFFIYEEKLYAVLVFFSQENYENRVGSINWVQKYDCGTFLGYVRSLALRLRQHTLWRQVFPVGKDYDFDYTQFSLNEIRRIYGPKSINCHLEHFFVYNSWTTIYLIFEIQSEIWTILFYHENYINKRKKIIKKCFLLLLPPKTCFSFNISRI